MPNQGWEQPTTITIRLRPALDGTLVELFHHGFEHTGGDISSEHAGYEQGWGMTQLLVRRARPSLAPGLLLDFSDICAY